MIIATNGIRKRTFTDSQWKNMPEGKYGWKLAAEEPEEVKELKAVGQKSPKVTPSAPAAGPETIESLTKVITDYDFKLKESGLHHSTVKSLERRRDEAIERLTKLQEGDADNNE